MSKFKKTLLKIHLTTLLAFITNVLIIVVFEVRLIPDLLLIVRVLFYVSAVILFFFYIIPFKKRAIYFGLYFFYPIFAFIGWLVDGIFGAILSSILFLYFVPTDSRFENAQIKINKQFTGFLGGCCKYEVIEKKYFLFERKIGEFQFEENLYFRKNDVKIQGNILQMHLVLKDYDEEKNRFVAKDTTIFTILKNK